MLSTWWGSATRYGVLVGLLVAMACGDNEASGPVTAPPAAVASVTVAPATASVLVGRQLTLTATPRDADNRPLERAVTWASGDATIATVSATGTVTAHAAGQVTITATSEGTLGTAVIDVAQVPVAEVRLSADDEVVLDWNGSTRLAATPLDAEGNALAGRTVTWQSSRPAVVTVAADGTLQARAQGTAIISATIEGQHANVGVRVHPVPVKSIAIDGNADGLEVGESVFLGVYLTGENDAPLQRMVTWTTSAPAVATVDDNNPLLVRVQAVGAGRVTITAAVDGKSATMSFAVTPPPTHDLVYTRSSANGTASELFVLVLAGGAQASPVRLNAGTVSREPSPSPDGLRLVFSVSQTNPTTGEPQHDLYIVQRDGRGMRQLTSMVGYEHQPEWSPDGSRILFRAAATVVARPELWVINPDGSGLLNLSANIGPAMTDLRDAAWSPDGTRIAFIGAVNGEHKVWIMNADGSNLRQLTRDVGFDSSPAWSPDGNAIAFTRWNVANPALGEDVMIVPVATGAPQRLALPGDQRTPAWSPDGQYLAMMGTAVAGSGLGNLYTMRLDGTGLRLRTVNAAWGGGHSPTWIRR